MKKCLYCYQQIQNDSATDQEFHPTCSKKIFDQNTPPLLGFTQGKMLELAKRIVKSKTTVTGVQPKLSLNIVSNPEGGGVKKFTIVGVLGKFILKPQTEFYDSLPEIEDLTMHLAQISQISTVDHSLIRLQSGELAYITKRVDRQGDRKLHMEDMCQLTERMTEHKYKGSHEQIAKVLHKYSANPGFDIINFYELVLFCFLTGNNDMHLKNFSLLKNYDSGYNLCPAYDLVASELVIHGDDEELALNLNGKRRKLKRSDFVVAMKTSGINEKAIENVFDKFANVEQSWHDFIDLSFLSKPYKLKYHEMIKAKFTQLDF